MIIPPHRTFVNTFFEEKSDYFELAYKNLAKSRFFGLFYIKSRDPGRKFMSDGFVHALFVDNAVDV